MYISYSGLWKVLISKNMTKSDLKELTGLSARVIAKLSKNETVTTDTIARICDALQCNVGDIMECVEEDRMSLYEAYLKFGKTIDESDFYKTVAFSKNGRKYIVYVTKFTATKATHIDCRENGTIYWTQLYMFGGVGGPSRVENILLKPQGQKDAVVIVLIKGKPGIIKGIDSGHFVSSRGVCKNDTDVYVMSESAFKLFEP